MPVWLENWACCLATAFDQTYCHTVEQAGLGLLLACATTLLPEEVGAVRNVHIGCSILEP